MNITIETSSYYYLEHKNVAPDPAILKDERKRLIARIAEIDSTLNDLYGI